MIKTFRGLIADGATDTVALHTNNGSTGYRVIKFQIIGTDPVDTSQESVVQIWTVNPNLPTATSEIDFSDQKLLASAVWANNAAAANYGTNTIVIFDSMIFNQDIYITHKEKAAAQGCNYYIELEQVKLDLNQNTVATLKDIRNND